LESALETQLGKRDHCI